MLVVGVTGLIGSGKTTVCNMFASRGVPIIDTDQIAHEIVRPKTPTYKQLIQEFGVSILLPNKDLDRKKLLSMMLSSPIVLNKLEQILHPQIYEKTLWHINHVRPNAPYVMIIVPLLFKCPQFMNLINRSLFIDSTRVHIKSRLMSTRGLTETQIQQILKLQTKRSVCLKMCNDVIVNNQDNHALEKRVKRLHDQYVLI